MYHDGMQYIRQEMLEGLMKKGINSGAVLNAMFNVPRHFFVSEALRYSAYHDTSLPIGFGQTISKPSVIGMMVQALSLSGTERVLEIGTGSGYQSAILSLLCGEVVSTERIRDLSSRASGLLARLGFRNVECIHTDDFNDTDGVFDRVVVAAGTDLLPMDIFSKMADGGILVIPLGDSGGHTIKRFIKKGEDSCLEEVIGQATFVPLLSGRGA